MATSADGDCVGASPSSIRGGFAASTTCCYLCPAYLRYPFTALLVSGAFYSAAQGGRMYLPLLMCPNICRIPDSMCGVDGACVSGLLKRLAQLP